MTPCGKRTLGCAGLRLNEAARMPGTMVTATHQDEDLLKAIREGRPEAFDEFVLRFKRLVLTIIYRHTGDTALTDDLGQEVFLRAYRGIGKFKGECSLSTWLTRITINVVNSYYVSRPHKERINAQPLTPSNDEREIDEDDTEEKLAEQRAAFREALQRLRAEHREIIVLCGIEGKSYEEVTEILKIPLGTVKSRLHAARLAVRDQLGLGRRGKEGSNRQKRQHG